MQKKAVIEKHGVNECLKALELFNQHRSHSAVAKLMGLPVSEVMFMVLVAMDCKMAEIQPDIDRTIKKYNSSS